MTVAVVAEKPAVGRDIAQVLGARSRDDGCLSGNGYVVTWAIGHLVVLAEPHGLNERWREWRLGDLPMLPEDWRLVVAEQTRDQFATVRRVLLDRDVTEVICATDAGREGELIFRYIYEAAGCKKPVRRLWISSLTPDAIARGFRQLRDGREYDALARAARGRSRADWLVGMNLSRAYSLVHGELFSVGRVQTPTLAMVAEREVEIRDFVPEDYFEVVATFRAGREAAEAKDAKDAIYTGTWFRRDASAKRSKDANAKDPKKAQESDEAKSSQGSDEAKREAARRLPKDGDEARRIVERTKKGTARVESVSREEKALPPPLLYDLTELQRHANRLYGMSAQRTLDVAQALYEKKKVLSYPRTDSRKLSRTVAETLPEVVRAIAAPYRDRLAPGTGDRPLGLRFVDDERVAEHHAIIPTATRAGDLTPDERRIYDLVCRRLLAAWHDDHRYAVTRVVTRVDSNVGEPAVDRFASTGTSVEHVGWKVLDVGEGKNTGPTLPGGLRVDQGVDVVDAKAVAKQTRPPPRYTDATLLTAMETAGRAVTEREIADAMRECGLGTPATRAATIELLLKREYIARDGKSLAATERGLALVDVVHPNVKSPSMTGEWERKLSFIERGAGDFDAFMRGIEGYVRDVVARVAVSAPPTPSVLHARAPAPTSANGHARASRDGDASMNGHARAHANGDAKPSGGDTTPQLALASTSSPARAAPIERRPVQHVERARPLSGQGEGALSSILRDVFGFASYRPYQEDVCRAATAGRDVLLVMPTGAGKSLCYQLPGLARGGTTLVVSPLIALMEDQVGKLLKVGLAAERVHSGRGREGSRAACRAYLDGRLDFLFIAPERLKVPGFPEMLGRRPPTLVAIDEAHCISQWGHDFRPEYRMLGERLPLLRPAPVIALTATATPTVQDDIVAQLRLDGVTRFIHGFRRTNIAVEVVEKSPGDRADATLDLLSRAERRPAIVYAPTRREAEAVAERLGAKLRVDAYHAGMDAGSRAGVQRAFLEGRLDVVVATIAFGMGIDKADVRTVVHTALPATVEGYYQEIGRAGRDGLPSRAILFQSFVDGKTHEFFHDRDYPAAASLAAIFDQLRDAPLDAPALAEEAGLAEAVFEKALEKLWVHGGARIEPDGAVRRGDPAYAKSYEKQAAHRLDQIARMRRYADKSICRMLQLVSHFGDRNDSGAPCGHCDVCAPDACVAQEHREPSAAERDAGGRVLRALAQRDGQTIGQIHRDVFAAGDVDRRSLEHVIGGLARAGIVRVDDDSFVKDGEVIAFQRVYLSAAARSEAAAGDPRFRITARRPPAEKRKGGRKRAARPEAKAARGRGKAKESRRTGVARTRGEGAGSTAANALFEALRAWRLEEAHKQHVPAFRVMNDRTLLNVATEVPGDEAALLRISGIGLGVARRYGAALLRIVARHARA